MSSVKGGVDAGLYFLIEMFVAIAIVGVIGAGISTAIGGMANQTRGLNSARWPTGSPVTT